MPPATQTTRPGLAEAAGAATQTQYVSVEEAAAILHVSPASIRRYLTLKTLRRFKANGTRTLLNREEVMGLIREA